VKGITEKGSERKSNETESESQASGPTGIFRLELEEKGQMVSMEFAAYPADSKRFMPQLCLALSALLGMQVPIVPIPEFELGVISPERIALFQ
jgi:hypothetical protein